MKVDLVPYFCTLLCSPGWGEGLGAELLTTIDRRRLRKVREQELSLG